MRSGICDALAAPRALVGALAADLHRRVRRRALAHLAGRQLRRVGRQPPGLRRSRPRGRRCSRWRRGGRPSRSAWAAPSASAGISSPGRRARAAARWRTGRACRRGPSRTPAERAAHARDDVVRGHPGGLVDQQDASTPLRPAQASVAVGVAVGGVQLRGDAPAQEGDQLVDAPAAWRSRRRGGGRRRPARARSATRRRRRRSRAARLCAGRGARRSSSSRTSTATFVPRSARSWSMIALGVAAPRRRCARSPRRVSAASVSSPPSKRCSWPSASVEQRELAPAACPRTGGGRRGHVDAGFDQLGGHQVRARAGVLVHEAPGVGDQADVQRLARRRASARRRGRASDPRRSRPCTRRRRRRG